jgi:SEC-C motif-containing protein
MSLTNTCQCGSEIDPNQCCLPIIEGQTTAKTAEELLRARYTAFAIGKVDFILDSHHSRTRHEIKREEVEDWSKNSEWLGLKIVQQEAGRAEDEKGTLIFSATYRTGDQAEEHWEKSFFEKEDGQWRFVDAHGIHLGTYRRAEPKVGRNDPCHCGSGKKSKKCCHP